MTTVERLIHMANQIAINLATDDDPVSAIEHHIQLFWDPRMKKLILDSDRTGLNAAAAAAINRLAETQNAA